MKPSLPFVAMFCGLLLLSATSRAQDLYVGSNAANVTTNFTSGTNLFGITYIGYSTNVNLVDPTNNVLNVSGAGTVLSNSSFLYVGLNGSGNRLVVSNGGQVYSQHGVLGWTENASNNSALVTGTNSKWTVGADLTLGGRASEISIAPDGNSLVVSNGGQVVIAGALRIGVFSINNSVLVTGSGSSVQGSVIMGGFATSLRNNSLVISNGGRVSGGYGYIGNWSSNSTALVTGTNSVWTNSGNLYVGYDSLGKGNRLVISNGATVANAEGIVGGGAVFTNTQLAGNFNNSVLVTGTNSLWINSANLVVGRNSDGNSLTLADGASVVVGTNLTINQYYRNTNGFSQAGSLVLVQSGRLSVTNGQINFGAGLGTLQVDGGTVEVKELRATTPITPSAQILPAESVGSFVLFNGGTIISGSTTISNQSGLSDNRSFYIGGNSGSGATFIANGGTHSFWANVAVGDAGSSNSLVITNGAEVFLRPRPDSNHGPSGGTNLVIGVAAGASNNSVSISSGRLVMTNGTLEIGRAGSGILNVHNGGAVQAPNVVVASQAGSSGTVNIGRFGTNDSAGTISAATIAFGAGTGVVNFNQSNAVTITSVISGAGTVRQLGSGTTILSASNTYTGGTTISAGTLELDSAGWVAGSISNNATLSLNRTNTLTLTNLVSGTGALSKSGTGTVILAGANTYSGNTTISAGTLQINAGGSVSNSATTLVGSNGAGTLSISGGTYSNTSVSIGHSGGTGILNLNSGSLSAQNLAVSGNGAVAGTLNLNGGTMAVSGSFYVASGGTINVNTGGVLRGGNGGQLWVDSTNSLINFNGGTGSSGLNLFVGNGGTVDLRGQSLGSNNWGNLVASGLGGVLRNSSTNAATIANQNTIWIWQGGQRLTIDASGGDILINSWITSSQMTNTGIIKTGTNALILANSGNDYNGGSFLQQGTLRLDHANAAGSGAITQSNAGSTLQINATGTVANAMSLYNIATLQTVTLSGAKTLNGATYNVAAGTTTTESGVLSGAGGLTKSGTGTTTLSASNTYTGDTAIGSGVLALTNGFAIADTAAVTNSGATLRVDSSETIGSLRGSGSTVLNGAAVTLTVAETNSQTYAGVISGAGGFAKAGIGTVTFTGANTYSGDTTINAGVLQIDVGGAVSNSTNIYVGKSSSGNSLVISNGGRVANTEGSIGYDGFSSNNSALVTGANSVWTNSGYFYAGAYGSSNRLVVSNGGMVAALISQIGTFSSSLNNSVLVTGTNSLFNNALYLFIGGQGNSGNSMVISNGGLVTVGIHSYIGGDVPADNNSVLVTGAGSRWSNAFGLYLGNAGLSNSLTVANGGTASAGSGLTIAASNGSVATLNIGRLGTNDTAGTITAPTIAFGAGTGVVNFNQSDATTITAAISGNGALKQLGTGTTTLSASNTYTGDTTISAGTLRFSTENSAGSSRIIQTTLNSLVEFLGGGRMTNQMTAFQYSFAESFEAAGQVTLADTASSISVASGKTVTGSGQFTGTGGLTKNGLGTLSLTAANNFSGPVAVQFGLLNLNASSGAAAGSISSVSVASGATLLVSRSDQVNNTATVTLSGGTIRRGGNVGEVFGNLTISTASFLDYGAANDAGTIRFGAYAPSALLTVQNFLPGNKLQFGNTISSTDLNNTSLFQFSNGFTTGTESGFFTITAIPEPSTYIAALGLLGLCLLPLVRRKPKVS